MLFVCLHKSLSTKSLHCVVYTVTIATAAAAAACQSDSVIQRATGLILPLLTPTLGVV